MRASNMFHVYSFNPYDNPWERVLLLSSVTDEDVIEAREIKSLVESHWAGQFQKRTAESLQSHSRVHKTWEANTYI